MQPAAVSSTCMFMHVSYLTGASINVNLHVSVFLCMYMCECVCVHVRTHDRTSLTRAFT